MGVAVGEEAGGFAGIQRTETEGDAGVLVPGARAGYGVATQAQVASAALQPAAAGRGDFLPGALVGVQPCLHAEMLAHQAGEAGQGATPAGEQRGACQYRAVRQRQALLQGFRQQATEGA